MPDPDLIFRRNAAMSDLGIAAKAIADEHNLCPLCLIKAVYNATMHAAETGEILHYADRHSDESKKWRKN